MTTEGRSQDRASEALRTYKRDWQPGRGRRQQRTPCTHATIFYDRQPGKAPVWRCGTGRHAVQGHVLDVRRHRSQCGQGVSPTPDGQPAVVATTRPDGRALSHPAQVPTGYALQHGSWLIARRIPEPAEPKGRQPSPGQLMLGDMPAAPKAKRRGGA